MGKMDKYILYAPVIIISNNYTHYNDGDQLMHHNLYTVFIVVL